MDSAAQLKKMQDAVDDAKTERANLQGRREELLGRLKDEFQLDSVEDAQSRLQELKEQTEEEQSEITVGLAELKTKFEW